MNNMETNITRKRDTINTDALTVPLIFIFLFCCEKAHDNEEFSRENSKSRC